MNFVHEEPDGAARARGARGLTNDPAKRAEIVNQILAYNEEDLDATWAVMEWLRALAAGTTKG